MAEPREVVIDGVLYLPAREQSVDTLEAVARALARLHYWGELAEPWEDSWDRHMAEVRVIVTDSSGDGISADEFLDRVSVRLQGGKT